MHEDLALGVAMSIRLEMVRKDIRGYELAKRLGKDPMWVSRRIRRESPATMTIPDLAAIAAALEVPVTDLIPEPQAA